MKLKSYMGQSLIAISISLMGAVAFSNGIENSKFFSASIQDAENGRVVKTYRAYVNFNRTEYYPMSEERRVELLGEESKDLDLSETEVSLEAIRNWSPIPQVAPQWYDSLTNFFGLSEHNTLAPNVRYEQQRSLLSFITSGPNIPLFDLFLGYISKYTDAYEQELMIEIRVEHPKGFTLKPFKKATLSFYLKGPKLIVDRLTPLIEKIVNDKSSIYFMNRQERLKSAQWSLALHEVLPLSEDESILLSKQSLPASMTPMIRQTYFTGALNCKRVLTEN